MSVLPQDLPEIPDWGRYHSPEELFREAMDYEENARYDRYDGFKEEFLDDADAHSDHCEYLQQLAEGTFVPYVPPAPSVPLTDDEIPF